MRYQFFTYYCLIAIHSCGFQHLREEQDTYIQPIEKDILDYQRNLQSQQCSETTKCANCVYGTCLKCQTNRVIPGCGCAFGYVDVAGVCTQCPSNCKQCSNPSTCTACYSQYSLSSGSCICNTQLIGVICNDPLNLYYTTEVAPDMQSIIITFSAPIRITNIASEGVQFSPLVLNCLILDTITLTNFGMSMTNPNDSSHGCYINQNQQNQFIVNPGPNFISANLLTPPVIVTTYLQRWNTNQLVSVPTAITQDTTIARQLNQIQQVCYFQNPQYQVPLASFMITPSYNYQNFQGLVFPASCQTISTTSTSSMVGNIWQTANCQSNIFDVAYVYFQPGDTFTAQMTCTGLYGFITSDQVILQFENSPDNLLLSAQTLPKMIFFNQDYVNNVSFSHQLAALSSTFDFIINVSTSPQIIAPYTITPTSGSSQILIPKYSVNTPTMVILTIKLATTDGTLSAVQQLQLWYQSSFKINVSSQYVLDIIPSNPFQLSSTITDLDVASTVSSQFVYYWACFNLLGSPCVSQNNVAITLSSTGKQISTAPQLPYNFSGYILVIAARQSSFLTQQYSYVQITTETVFLTVTSTTPASLRFINLYDQFQINLFLQTNIPQPTNPNYKYTVSISYASTSKTLITNGNIISLCLQDYFPVINFATSNQVSLSFTISGSPLLYPISISSPVVVSINQPPSGCSISTGSSTITAFSTIASFTVTNCVLNGQTFNYQFFYYTSLQQQLEEIISPSIVNRIELSISSSASTLFTLLPPGNLILMVILSGPNNIMANFTLPITVINNNFSQQSYEQSIISQYGSDLGLSSSQSELLGFQLISLAIQQYEGQNTSYTPSSQINDIKNDILTSMQSSSWSTMSNDIYLMSQQVLNRIVSSKIQMSASAEQALKSQNEQEIANLLTQISSISPSKMTPSQRTFFQQILGSTISNYLQSLNGLNSWKPDDSSNAIKQLSNAMDGISLTMLINQAAVVLKTQGPTLSVENLDFQTVMSKYFDTKDSSQPTSVQLSQNYYFQIQTYPETHPLYRDELVAINQPHLANATSEDLPLLQRTYPIIIPKIQINQNSQFTHVDMNVPVIIPFGPYDQSEKLKCIQRSSSGQWVSNNCQLITSIVNSQTHVSCKCKSPDITSIIAEIESIINNKNINDIVSSEGLQRLISLSNWYEYAPIWAIVALNILIIALLFIGKKLDNRDKKNDSRRVFLANRFGCISVDESTPKTNIDTKETVFMQIKNKKKCQREDSADSPLQFSAKVSESMDSPTLFLNNNDDNTTKQNRVKSIFARQILKDNLDTEEVELQTQKLVFCEMKEDCQKNSNSNKSNDICPQDVNIMLSPTLGPFLPTEQPDDKDQHVIMFDEIFEQQIEQEEKNEQNKNDSPQLDDKNQQIVEDKIDIDFKLDSKGEDDKNVGSNIKQDHNLPLHLEQSTLKEECKIDEKVDNIDVNCSKECTILGTDKQQQNPEDNKDCIDLEQSKEMKQMADLEMNKSKEEQEIDGNQNKHYQNINFTDLAQSMISNPDSIQSHQTQEISKAVEEEDTNNILTLNKQMIKAFQKTQKKQNKEEKSKDKKMKKKTKQEKKVQKEKDARVLLQEYLQSEKKIKAVFALHVLISTFIVYNRKLTRVLRFIIYYNKMMWLLTINSIFGEKLSIVQVLTISVISTVVLNMLTILLITIFSNKKLKVFGMVLSFLFLILCYYSILVVMSSQDSTTANEWIISYIATLILNEYVIGIPTCLVYYEILKRYTHKIKLNFILQMLGASILLKAFQS